MDEDVRESDRGARNGRRRSYRWDFARGRREYPVRVVARCRAAASPRGRTDSHGWRSEIRLGIFTGPPGACAVRAGSGSSSCLSPTRTPRCAAAAISSGSVAATRCLGTFDHVLAEARRAGSARGKSSVSCRICAFVPSLRLTPPRSKRASPFSEYRRIYLLLRELEGAVGPSANGRQFSRTFATRSSSFG